VDSSIRVLLASDLHGSNACFQKLVALALELRVGSIVVAGDWSGKRSMVYERTPIGGLQYRSGDNEICSSESWRDTVEQWKNAGIYPIDQSSITTNSRVDDITRGARIRRLRQWLDYGQELCGEQGVRLFSIPGNDDGDEIVEVLDEHPWVCNVDGRKELMESHEVFGLGYSNPTPWRTPRELTEAQIDAKLRTLAGTFSAPNSSIAVIHVPPFASGLDSAPELKRRRDGQLQMTGNGEVPVGSTSVAGFVETFCPLIVLSGHCHSSRNFARIGKTSCFNAGSQYHVGVLSACLLLVSRNSLVDYQFIIR
jgi:Icc-related predicted phosphoesterase